jgi:hypothetical protein
MLEKRLRPGDLRLRNRLCQPKTAAFPEKFPVSREFGRRRVRTALCRQPVIPAFGDSLQPAPHGPGNPGFSAFGFVFGLPVSQSPGPNGRKFSGRFPKNPVSQRLLSEISSMATAARP